MTRQIIYKPSMRVKLVSAVLGRKLHDYDATEYDLRQEKPLKYNRKNF